LRNKIETIRTRNVLVYPGGTLTEYAIIQGVCRDYMRHAVELGFNGIEISDGTIELAKKARRDAIRFALDLGLTVVAEVGKKDPDKQPSLEALAEQALADFDAGASWVTVEARESGRGVGVFDEDGTVVEQDVDRLAGLLEGRTDRILWESPLKRQQDYFIHRFGPNVCLGNIQPRDVLALEALRTGLRFETFRSVAEQLEVTAEDSSTE
jgi:phosphosulfolactate synthase